MASLTIRLNEFSQFLGWEVAPLELLEWIKSQLPYLPQENAEAVEEYFTRDVFEGEYFRVNEGRVALYALYRQMIYDRDFLSDMQVEIDDHYHNFKLNGNVDALMRAFCLAEYLAQTATQQDEMIKFCLLASHIGIDAKEWKATYKLAMRPFAYGFVPEAENNELLRLASIARKEMRHAEDYPNG